MADDSAEDIAGETGTIGATPQPKQYVWIGDYIDVPDRGEESLTDVASRVAGRISPFGGKSRGGVSKDVFTRPDAPKGPTKKKELTVPIDDATMAYFGFDPQKKQALINFAIRMGKSPEQINDQMLAQMWAQYVQLAAAYQAQGKMWTPWSVMMLDSMTMEQTKKTAMPKAPVTQTSTSTDLSTMLDARGILNTASRTLLGRDPTQEEATRFWQSLNAAERENPVTTTQTTTFDAEGNVATQESVSSGGMSADAKQVLTEDVVKANVDYGAYQAGTNYMGILRNMVYGG